MKIFWVLFFTLISSYSFACDFEDISKESMFTAREALSNNMNNPGHRLSFVDFKNKNKAYGGGSVDDAVDEFVAGLCEQFRDLEKEQKIKLHIKKTDFKGFYINCTPSDVCKKQNKALEDKIKRLKTPEIASKVVDKKTGKVLKKVEDSIQLSFAKGSSYTDGYVRSRTVETYLDFKPADDVAEFLDNKVKEGLDEAFGIKKDLGQSLTIEQKVELNKGIENLRAGNEKDVPKRLFKLITAIDAMEVPFFASDNFEAALNKATTITTKDKARSQGKYIVKKALSGDDVIYVIIKDGKIQKILGADAKGLGVLNSAERLDGYMQFKGKLNSLADLKAIGEKGIENADFKMIKSMNEFERNLMNELNTSDNLKLESKISNANNKYRKNQGKAQGELMEMRAGYIDGCFGTTTCIKNNITNIHNKLKILEQHGHNGYLGDSCIGVEYRLRKLGINTLKSSFK